MESYRYRNIGFKRSRISSNEHHLRDVYIIDNQLIMLSLLHSSRSENSISIQEFNILQSTLNTIKINMS